MSHGTSTHTGEKSVEEEVRWELMANNGRPKGHYPPPSTDHIHPDPREPRLVEMVVSPHPDWRWRHWLLSWHIKTEPVAIHRVVHIVQDPGRDHYTNWGPITRTADATYEQAAKYPLATMNFEQRQALEKIAEGTGVYWPNGKWNCQDWLVEVMGKALDQGLVTKDQVDTVLQLARQ